MPLGEPLTKELKCDTPECASIFLPFVSRHGAYVDPFPLALLILLSSPSSTLLCLWPFLLFAYYSAFIMSMYSRPIFISLFSCSLPLYCLLTHCSYSRLHSSCLSNPAVSILQATLVIVPISVSLDLYFQPPKMALVTPMHCAKMQWKMVAYSKTCSLLNYDHRVDRIQLCHTFDSDATVIDHGETSDCFYHNPESPC